MALFDRIRQSDDSEMRTKNKCPLPTYNTDFLYLWNKVKDSAFVVAAKALWFCLRLPSCGPRFESEALHLHFFQFVIELWCEKDKNKRKRGRDWPIFF